MKQAYFNYIGILNLPSDCVDDCSHSGRCDDDVAHWVSQPEIKSQLDEINPEQLVKELDEHGAWSEEELSNHDDNLLRILWIAATNIADEQ
jgi:hypothetical protein